MKTLLLMRHAKSSWADEGLTDFDRPLNARGERDAPRMGAWMQSAGLLPQAIYCSTAVRARTTVEMLTESARYDGPVTYLDELYLAAPETYVEVIQQLNDDIDAAMMIAHNPGMEMMVRVLTEEWEPMPTAALAIIELPIETWSEFSIQPGGRLVDLHRPKEIDFS